METQIPKQMKAWISGAGLALLIFLYPLFAVAPLSAPTARVQGDATVSPLGLPAGEGQNKVPNLQGTIDLSKVKARSFLAFDLNTKQVLAEKDSTQPVAIASLTKLMTAWVSYQNITSFKQTVTISDKDRFSVDPVLGLRTGDEVYYSDLFYGMLVGSANDAALTLANHIEQLTGKNFVELMNQQATDLGMNDTHFSNPLGFDSEANYSTAKDLAALVGKLHQYQAFTIVGKEQSYAFQSLTGTHYSVKATNTLVSSNKDLYAIKTGFTTAAQGAMVTEVKGDGYSFVIIVLDSPDREGDTLALRSEVLQNYVWSP